MRLMNNIKLLIQYKERNNKKRYFENIENNFSPIYIFKFSFTRSLNII